MADIIDFPQRAEDEDAAEAEAGRMPFIRVQLDRIAEAGHALDGLASLVGAADLVQVDRAAIPVLLRQIRRGLSRAQNILHAEYLLR